MAIEITVEDYRIAMPSWKFTGLGSQLVAMHPLGVEIRKPFGGPIIGDKNEILKADAELFCDLAARHLALRE